MNLVRRNIACLLICLILVLPMMGALRVRADEPEAAAQEAVEITDWDLVTDFEGFHNLPLAFDGHLYNSPLSEASATLTLSYEAGIGSLYVLYGDVYGAYTVTNNDTGEVCVWGESGFLHEFIDLEGAFGSAPSSVTLSYANGAVAINEIYAFTAGEVPSFVQKWNEPMDGRTDMILFSTHGDDEQLFFAGLLPYYANALGYRVQVVYLTDHRNLTDVRIHEMLNGLWAVGVDIYPVFGTYDDFLLETKEETYQEFERLGTTKDDLLSFVVEQLRRFKPLVVVGHDFAGEYSHGQHMVYAECLAEALKISNDPSIYPELAEEYGVWDVPKAYFHLYEENPIVMDWDTPMEELNGMTPFEVTQQLGFPCHESQQWTWFNGWINGKTTPITEASEIATYSPCLYGLYRSTVGEDVEKNDFFENVTIYAEQERIAAEEEARLEEEVHPEEETRPEAESQDTASETTTPEDTAPSSADVPSTSETGKTSASVSNLVLLAMIVGIAVIVLVILICVFKKINYRGKYSR